MSSKNDSHDIKNIKQPLKLVNQINDVNNQLSPLNLVDKKIESSINNISVKPLKLIKEVEVRPETDIDFLKKEINIIQKKQYEMENELNISRHLNEEHNKKILDLERKNDFFLDHNEKLKDLLENYIDKYEDFQNKINNVETKKIDELNHKIKFYQDENIRLSSDLSFFQKKYETVKKDTTEIEVEKNKIFKHIEELNSLLANKTNVVSPYKKSSISKDSTNINRSNNIKNKDLEELE